MTLTAPGLDVATASALLVKEHPGHYGEMRLGYRNQPFHWEWYNHELLIPRLAVIAPRDTAKSEVFSVVSTCWFAERWPGSWQYVFCDSEPQGKLILERIVSAMILANIDLGVNLIKDESTDVIFGNYSRVTVAGIGKRVRTAHPDRVVGDDVLNDQSTGTSLQRGKVNKWWFGTVAGMGHTGVWRRIGWGRAKTSMVAYFPSTRFRVVGTPFHRDDLLMGMKRNPIYRYYRYAAEFQPADLVPGTWALEAA